MQTMTKLQPNSESATGTVPSAEEAAAASSGRSRCPICMGSDLAPVGEPYRGDLICSNLTLIKGAALSPVCCRGCGLVFESRGIRSQGAEFFKAGFQPKPAVQYFDKQNLPARPQKALEFLSAMADIPATGTMLDVGAGKGDFLACFGLSHPRWSLVAVEPGKGGEAIGRELPGVELHHIDYDRCDIAGRNLDLVVALGVLEHVNDPLHMMRWVGRGLRPGGVFFVELPNFEQLPGDLMCPDHLTKFTPDTFAWLAHRGGFTISRLVRDGVPFYACLTKREDAKAPAPPDPGAGLELAQRHRRYCRDLLGRIGAARRRAAGLGEGFAIFGLTTLGVFAPLFCGFGESDLVAFIDENPRYHGRCILGARVGGLELIGELGIRHLALAVSPVYVELVKHRLAGLDVVVYD